MRSFVMQTDKTQQAAPAARRDSERGAALITVVLVSTLLLAAGGALMLVTATSASNAYDATAESQAYYAAEAGIQQVLGVLRGHVAPSPLIDSTSTNAAGNKVSFRKALLPATSNASGTGTARLTRWLNYHSTYTDRVALTTSYAPLSGMAYGVESIADPDFSDNVTFSTTGTFVVGGGASKNFGGGANEFTLTYTPVGTTNLATNGTSAATTLGTFTVSGAKGTLAIVNEKFKLTIRQTKPWVVDSVLDCTISGAVVKAGSVVTSTLLITFPDTTSAASYFLGGVEYTPTFIGATRTIAITSAGAIAMNATVKPPEPQRLLVRVRGYGPRNAVKQMQVLIGRSAFSFNASGAITLRSAGPNDTGAEMEFFHAGNSANYQYDGNDSAGGADLPAFSVTNNADLTKVTNFFNASTPNHAIGTAPVVKVPISSLDMFLQTTTGMFGARQAVENLRTMAKNQMTPGCTPATPSDTSTCDRYFASGQTPSTLGTSLPNGLLTFVDGDMDLPPGGGAGLLVITGTLTMNGSADFKGLVLVLGRGKVTRNGGGGDTSLGAMAVARFDNTTDEFQSPYFDSNGGGNAAIRFNSDWVRRALGTTGPGVLAISEY